MLNLSRPQKYYSDVLEHVNCFGVCGTKTSKRKNATLCKQRKFAKYGGKCVRHSRLPPGSEYTCMYKSGRGATKGKFCDSALTNHHLFCSAHTRWKWHKDFDGQVDVQLLEKDHQFKQYVFLVFERGLKKIFTDLSDDIFIMIKDLFMSQNPFDTLKRIRRASYTYVRNEEDLLKSIDKDQEINELKQQLEESQERFRSAMCDARVISVTPIEIIVLD